MPIFKCTMLFEQQVDGRGTAGWSESWYRDEATAVLAQIAFSPLNVLRAGMLNDRSAIIAQRVEDVTTVGQTLLTTLRYPGPLSVPADSPYQALNIRFGLGNLSHATRLFRGVPDPDIAAGALVPGAAITGAANNFCVAVLLNGWKVKSDITAQQPKAVKAIDINGTVVMYEDLVIVADDKVSPYRLHDITGKNIRGIFRFDTVVDSKHFTLANWDNPNDVDEGKLRIHHVNYPNVVTFELQNIVSRKVGRIFRGWRGRQRKAS